jgi:uncharacterized protein YjiS (DUF1127 family)
MRSNRQLPDDLLSPMLATHADEANRPLRSSAAYDAALAARSTAPDAYVRSSLHVQERLFADRRTDESGSVPISAERDTWWRSVLAALSWVMAEILQGFAAYGEAMYPICFDLGEHLDRRDPAGLQRGGQACRRPAGLAEPADVVARSGKGQTASPNSSAGIVSPLAELRSRLRRERERSRTMMELKALDDRTLRDIGISRHPVGYFPRNGDHCE